MAITHLKSRTKKTSALRRRNRAKRKFELGSEHPEIKVGDLRSKPVRVRGGKSEIKLLAVDVANILDPKTKKSSKTKILRVLENGANPHYVRRNIITKGAIIETELGKARVTSRLGQQGNVDGVLV